MSDAELIEVSLGSPTAFGDLMLRHYGLVFAFVARRLGQGQAGDVASEVFSRAFNDRAKAAAYRGTCLLWLYRIAQAVVDSHSVPEGAGGGHRTGLNTRLAVSADGLGRYLGAAVRAALWAIETFGEGIDS